VQAEKELNGKPATAREQTKDDSCFQKNVEAALHKVGMPNAVFTVDVRKTKNNLLNDHGFTEVKFLFSANKGFARIESKR
jgi:DNA repair ATPase RecN